MPIKLFDKSKRAIIISGLLISHLQTYSQTDSVKVKVELEEVEITGQRTPSVYNQLSRKIIVLGPDEIKASFSSTIQDLLEYVPFADIRQRNSHGVQADISLRGGSFDQVMILLNGVNITDPQTGHFNLDLPIELNSVERIEILPGSGSRLYGANAYKGVINIITRKNENNLNTGISYGQHNLFQAFATAGLSDGRLYSNISFSKNISDGFTNNTDYNITHLFYRGGLTGRLIDIDLQAGTGIKNFGANDFYSPSFPDQYEETSARFGSIGISTKGKIKYSASAYTRSHNDHFLLKRQEPSFYENYHRTGIYGFRTNASFSSILGKTSAGAELRHEGILSSSLGEELSSPVRVKGTHSAYYSKEYSRNTSGLFIEHNIVLNNLSFTGGFMADINSGNPKKVEFFPGIDASYSIPGQRIKLFASVNRSLRLPTFTDMFYRDPSNQGNNDLIPEKLFAIETGMNFRYNANSAGVTIFRDRGKDVIDWIWNSGDQKYHTMNIAEITTMGIELRADHNFRHSGSFSLARADFSYAYTGLEKATGNYESKYSLDHLRHKLQLGLSNNIVKNLTAEWRLSYYSRNGSYLSYNEADKSIHSSAFRPYWLLDAGVTYTAGKISMNISISNLLDTKYTDVGSLFQPGRWITAGMQFYLNPGK